MKTGWQTKPLGDVCDIDKEQGIYLDLPYVGLEHIESQTARFIGSRRPQRVRSSTFRFSSEHLLYGRLRPYLNKVLAPDFDGHCSTEVFPIRPRDGLSREYLLYWFLSKETVDRVNATCTGTRMPRADMGDVMAFDFPLPSRPEQQRIVGILDEAFAAVATARANAEQNLRNAAELFRSRLAAIVGSRGDDWVDAPLGQHVRFVDYRGHTPIKTEAGLRLITAKNVKMGFLQEDPKEYVSPDIYERWMTRGIPRVGDVLFTTEAPLANIAQLDTSERVVFAQRIIIMQPDSARLDATFLKYLLLSSQVQDRIRKMATGATVSGIKARLLKTVPIEFPKSIDAQRSIAAGLDALGTESERLTSIYERKLAALEALKQSLLHQAFTGAL